MPSVAEYANHVLLWPNMQSTSRGNMETFSWWCWLQKNKIKIMTSKKDNGTKRGHVMCTAKPPSSVLAPLVPFAKLVVQTPGNWGLCKTASRDTIFAKLVVKRHARTVIAGSLNDFFFFFINKTLRSRVLKMTRQPGTSMGVHACSVLSLKYCWSRLQCVLG